MHFTNALVGLATVFVATANAQAGATIKVTVGEGGKLQYSPNDIVAAVGTNIEFSFFPKNHTVTQSSFSDPCHPLSGGFFSGFVPTKDSPSGTTFTINVKDTKPIWIYCGQTVGNHCQSGMVAAINAPISGNTFAAFQNLAKNATTSTSPPGGPVGGVLSVASNTTTTSTKTSATSSSTATFAAFTGAANAVGANALTGGAALLAALAMF